MIFSGLPTYLLIVHMSAQTCVNLVHTIKIIN